MVSAANENRKREQLMEATLFINGEWTETKSGTVIDDINPYDHSVVARAHMAGPDEVEAAINAAWEAFSVWGKLGPDVREEYLLKVSECLKENMEKYANWLIDESGSCYIKAMDEVEQSVHIFRSAAGECRRVNGGIIPSETPGQLSTYIRVPIGVVAGIAPFNYPLVLAAGKVALALAAGNTFVLKPSSNTPLSGRIIAECMAMAGLPKGVFNLVPGPGSIVGKAFSSDPRIRMVTFTGSTKVGKGLAVQCAQNLKRYTLEMGGKNPLIVLKDFDIDEAVSIAVFGAYFHQGQICMGTSRIIVEEDIYNDFCVKLSEKVRTLPTGDPHIKNNIIGPLIEDDHYKVLDSHIRDAVKKGALLLCGGGHNGNVYEASVLADVTPEMDVFYEESFGPLTSIIKAKNTKEAVTLANNSGYGLSSAILTNDLRTAMKMAPNIEAGMIHVNGSTVLGSRQAPFGGIKDSGVGREGSAFSIEEFTGLRWITYQIAPMRYPTD